MWPRATAKAYLWIECVWGNLLWLACSVVFYHLLGLIGLGIGFAVRGVIDIVVNYIVCRRRYGFTLARRCKSGGGIVGIGYRRICRVICAGSMGLLAHGGIAALSGAISAVAL